MVTFHNRLMYRITAKINRFLHTSYDGSLDEILKKVKGKDWKLVPTDNLFLYCLPSRLHSCTYSLSDYKGLRSK